VDSALSHGSLVPRPSTATFVACSTNTGEGLVKLVMLSDVPGSQVNV